MNAVIIIDKPAGFTSHDVVNRARRILQTRSVGHLGTLDPMATGVLPLVIGNLTRLAQFYLTCEKTYEGTIRFGFATDTYDADGEPTSQLQEPAFGLAELQQLSSQFRGTILQTPPAYSAKKIKGVPAYQLARKQIEVALKPVEVNVKEFDILNLQGDLATFRATVASGTYMRSIAHDMGRALGCGAHLTSLRRTRLGEFGIEDAHTLDQLSAAGPDACAVHPRKLLEKFPCVTADEDAAARIRSGRPVNLPEMSQAKLIKVFAGQRELIAIASRIAGTLFHPKIVFPVG